MGMAATQSHAMRLDGAPAVRLAWNGQLDAITRAAGPFVATLFTAVMLGVLDEAIAHRHASSCAPKADELRPTSRSSGHGPSRTTGSRCRRTKARCGRSSRAIRRPRSTPRCAPRKRSPSSPSTPCCGSHACIGGGTFSRRSPFAHWFEDVRALGFLRPPWGLAYDQLFATSIQ